MSVLLFAAAALAPVGPPPPAETRNQAVRLAYDYRARSCSAQVGSVEVGDPATDAGHAALVRALPDRDRRVQLLGTHDLPYRCVEGVVTALQHEGYRGVTIGTDQPAARP